MSINFIVLRAMSIIFDLKSMKKQLFDLVYGLLHLKCLFFGSTDYSYLDIDNSPY